MDMVIFELNNKAFIIFRLRTIKRNLMVLPKLYTLSRILYKNIYKNIQGTSLKPILTLPQ